MKRIIGLSFMPVGLAVLCASSQAATVRGFAGSSKLQAGGVPAVTVLIKDIGQSAATVSLTFGAGLPNPTTARFTPVAEQGKTFPVWSHPDHIVAIAAPDHDPSKDGKFQGTVSLNPDTADRGRILEDVGQAIPEDGSDRLSAARAIVEKLLSGDIDMEFDSPIRY